MSKPLGTNCSQTGPLWEPFSFGIPDEDHSRMLSRDANRNFRNDLTQGRDSLFGHEETQIQRCTSWNGDNLKHLILTASILGSPRLKQPLSYRPLSQNSLLLRDDWPPDDIGGSRCHNTVPLRYVVNPYPSRISIRVMDQTLLFCDKIRKLSMNSLFGRLDCPHRASRMTEPEVLISCISQQSKHALKFG